MSSAAGRGGEPGPAGVCLPATDYSQCERGVLRSCECPCLVSVSLYNECTVDYSRLATDSGPPGREDRVILIRA